MTIASNCRTSVTFIFFRFVAAKFVDDYGRAFHLNETSVAQLVPSTMSLRSGSAPPLPAVSCTSEKIFLIRRSGDSTLSSASRSHLRSSGSRGGSGGRFCSGPSSEWEQKLKSAASIAGSFYIAAVTSSLLHRYAGQKRWKVSDRNENNSRDHRI